MLIMLATAGSFGGKYGADQPSSELAPDTAPKLLVTGSCSRWWPLGPDAVRLLER
jgi:hypothetical protein